MNELSFCKFHFPEKINKVIWEITNQCNYSCEYCIFSSTGKKPRGELDFAKVSETLIELKKLNFNYIKFTGGEPFLREDFLDILLQAKQLGFQMDISTNASLITENISKQLSSLQINFIHVSLDGYDKESHEYVRGNKTFDKTLSGLNNLLKHNPNIRLGCVIHSKNDSHLQKIADFANHLGVQELIFSLMSPIGRMDKNSLAVSQKSPQELIDSISKITSQHTKVSHNLQSDIRPINQTLQFNKSQSSQICPGGDRFLFINSIGIISPCTWVSESFPEFHLQSLHHQSLIDILNSQLFKKFNQEKQKYPNQCFASLKNINENLKIVHVESKNNVDIQFNQSDNRFNHQLNAFSVPLNFPFNDEKNETNHELNNKLTNRFNSIYSFATENISFIDSLPICNKNDALVITGSGDQAIYLAGKGFNHITCIDVNFLSNYFAELKIVAMKHLSFQEFISFFKNNPHSFNYHVYKKLSQHLSFECEQFWNQQYIKHQNVPLNISNSGDYSSGYNSGYKIRNHSLFNLKYDDWEKKLFNVPYIRSEEKYMNIQNHISSTKFKFITHDFIDVQMNQKYDLILLSNIADYSHKMFEGDYLEEFKNKILKKGLHILYEYGIIMFAYIYDFENMGNSHLRNKINLPHMRKHYFSEFDYQEIKIKSAIPEFSHDVACYMRKRD